MEARFSRHIMRVVHVVGIIPKFVVFNASQSDGTLTQLLHDRQIGTTLGIFAPPIEPAGNFVDVEKHADKFFVRNLCEMVEKVRRDVSLGELQGERIPVESVCEGDLVLVAEDDGDAASYDRFVEVVGPR